MVLCCGGHPLPLVLRADGAVEPVGKLGTLLGADVEPVLTDVDGRPRPGRAGRALHRRRHRGPRGAEEIFGHRDLAELLGALRRPRARRGGAGVQDAVLDAAGGRPRDDIAILVVGAAPPPTPPILAHFARARRPPEATDG